MSSEGAGTEAASIRQLFIVRQMSGRRCEVDSLCRPDWPNLNSDGHSQVAAAQWLALANATRQARDLFRHPSSHSTNRLINKNTNPSAAR
jgi:hypothetical protein